ncbi:PREDICTED: uncharacterized protein LOC104799576 [Tarenaya hassleriana]|uniref:uncharacterized protein LOC104799576 n=1 Tax=Tarenaya hassleriana TaxID=28532 RepID=UPI00053C282A|nr:PREDICTED: uncharacterized protein LOC104799576 [Tarenaya hassleriana]
MADVMLPSTAADLRRLSELASTRSLSYVPDFVLNDFCRKMYSENRGEKLQLLKGLSLGRDDTVNLSQLRQEILLIWGDQDLVFPLRMARELKEILGERTRLEVIEETSHLPQLEKPNEFNAILMSFLCTSSS